MSKQLLGFTLIETLIYTALFSVMFTGIFVSVYPLFTGAERLSASALREGEILFLQAKIEAALTDTITSSAGLVISPTPGSTAHELVLGTATSTHYTFREDTTSNLCNPPRRCSFVSVEQLSQPSLPLNNERIAIEHFTITHTPQNPITAAPRFLDISFTADGELVGPLRYYLRF